MSIIIGSARSDENKKYSGGRPGDQRQKSNTNDRAGEVSMQEMYKHKLGWDVLRPTNPNVANLLAEAMIIGCNNPNIGYAQDTNSGVVSNGVLSKKPTNADCGTLVRACCKYAGFDPGAFYTATEAGVLEKSGYFEKRFTYVSQAKTPLFDGDVLVTKTKGHTAIVVSGNPRKAVEASKALYYPKYTEKSQKIDEILHAIGAPCGSVLLRTPVANANGISNYKGSYEQNIKINSLAKAGKLKRV